MHPAPQLRGKKGRIQDDLIVSHPKNIKRLINALDDPFLPQSCYPVEQAKNNPKFHLETPKNGGHIGFVTFGKDNIYWSERRAIEFLIPTLSPTLPF